MKTLLTIAGVIAFSAVAQAGSISYDFRLDMNGTDYNDAAGKQDYSKFYFKTGRVDFKGKLNDSLSYQLRWAYTKSQTATTRDAAPAGIELGYVTHKMNDMFSLSAGKFNTLIGGFEAATAGPDLYLTSAAYNKTGAVGIASKVEGTGNLLYNTGVKLGFSFGEQTQNLDIVATDGINDATNGVAAGADFNQNRGLLGVIWRGAFMEKALNFMVSYHTVSPQTTTGTAYNGKDMHNFIAAGVKWESDPMAVVVDYLTNSFKDDALSQTDTMNTVVAKFIYKMGVFTPRIEATMSEEKKEIGGTATNKYNGVGLAVEYKPTEDNFRYHLAYATYTDKLDGAADDRIRQEIVVGARLLGDFLK